MKKAGSNSKDRLAKSGNTKKRTPSGSGQPTNAGLTHPGTGTGFGGAPSIGSDESQDAPVVIWPEWSDAEVAAEKWAVKHVFEDPEGLPWLPRSLRGLVDGFKRPVDLAPEGQSPICIQPLHLEDEMFHSTAPSSTGSVGFGSISTSPGLTRSYSKTSNADAATSVMGTSFPEAVLESPEGIEKSDRNQREGVEDGGGNLGSSHSPGTPAVPGTPAAPGHAQGLGGNSLGSSHGSNMATTEEAISTEEDITASASANKTVEDEASDQEILSGTSKLLQANRHLLGSELMRTILSTLHFLYDQYKKSKASSGPASGTNASDEFCPWDQIYPKSKDGLPIYNISGKYAVKLFWLGAWRKITVDDRLPVDSEGRPLVVSSVVVHEIWPMLLTKALLKVVALSYKETDQACEFGDFDVFHTLKGWLPEKLPVHEKPSKPLWAALSALNIKTFQSGLAPPLTGTQASRGGSVNPASSTTMAKDRGAVMAGPGDRSTMASANGPRGGTGTAGTVPGGKQSPFVVIFAWREGEEASEKLDVNTIAVPCRIMDIRETVIAPGIQAKDLSNVDLTTTQRLIRLRSYYSCGHFRARKPGDTKGNSKVVEEPPSEAAFETTDCWMPYSEFCRVFRSATVYHSQGSFKFVKSVHSIPDPAKASENLRIPQVLYLPDVTKDLSVFVFLSTYGRVKNEVTMQVSSALVEEYDWKGTAERRPVLRMTTNAALCSYLRIPEGRQAYRFIVNCPTSYSLSVWARDEFLLEDEGKYLSERLEVHVRDIDETFPAQPANSWFLLVKNIVHFAEPTFLATSIFVPEYIQQSTCLRMFDNDTNEEIPQVFYQLRPRTYLPNQNGYTLVADCRISQPKPSGKWKLRFVSEPIPVIPPERPLEMWTKPIVQDFDDIYTPNKHNVLFRYVVKAKDAPMNCVSMQLTFSFPSIWLKLQVFDNGVEVQSARGKGIATIYALNLMQTDDPVVAPTAVTKTEKGTDKPEKSEKKGKDGPKESLKELLKDYPGTVTPPVNDLPPIPKHKYIVQGSVENVELSKLVGLLPATPAPVGEPNRPPSRGVKAAPSASASAKKKRSATISGGSGAAVQNQAGTTGEERSVPTGNEPSWRLRIISTDTASLGVARDTEKEDRYRAIKDSWETAQPGRAARAREARDTYLKQVEAGIIRPIFITGVGGKDVPYKPWTIHGTMAAARLARRRESMRGSHSSMIREDTESETPPPPPSSAGQYPQTSPSRRSTASPSRAASAESRLMAKPHVLTPEEMTELQAERDSRQQEHERYQESVRKVRAEDREKRAHDRQLFVDKIEEKMKQVEGFKELDISRREAYRQKVIKEIEEAQAKARAAMEAAARESALAAEQGVEMDAASMSLEKDKLKKRAPAKR
ncbi:hypothetical protein SpCBS45565_g07927 [Spizellomyces sp. 'palustris']|nr:hypothetical protein SpCBS45565_g07927 [Spizellomyces sp. 'palustris']